MASGQPASEVFGQMRKNNSSSSQSEEWPGARKHGRWLRWSSALTVGLAVAAGVSIPLDEKNNKSNDERLLNASSSTENTIGEAWESYSPTPFPESRTTGASSEKNQRKWDIDTRLSVPNQEPAAESSTVLTEPQGTPRREDATPAQGSDDTIGGGEAADIRKSPQQAMLEIPRAPAVGRIPPVRPLPTPIPTPPPIRSPQ
jgi:hypothetical protein